MEKKLDSDTQQLRMTVYASLFGALISAGAYIAIPIGPVPIVLQNMFVLLAGLLLGSRWGLGAVFVYLLAGAVGLPVFAGGTGGIERFAGPTGGYLISYLPAVFIVGLISEKTNHSKIFDLIALILGVTIVYAIGVPWLKAVGNMSYAKALTFGMYPFIIGDIIKIAAAIPIANAIRPLMYRNLECSESAKTLESV